MPQAQSSSDPQVLSNGDQKVLIAGLTLLFICALLHLAAFAVRLWHHCTNLRRLWLVRLVQRPNGGSVIVFSPGLTWIIFGFVLCLAKGLHGSLKLAAEQKDGLLSSSKGCGYLAFYMVTFTLECLASWIVWSSTLVQASQSYESFMSQSINKGAKKQLWFLREGRWWNIWFLGCPLIIVPIMIGWIAWAMVSYDQALQLRDRAAAIAATDMQTAQELGLKASQLTKNVLSRTDAWIIMMVCWVCVTAITYGYATIQLLISFKREESFISRLKRGSGAVNKPSFHDKHLQLQGYAPNLPLVSARHTALAKKSRQLIIMNLWILAFGGYILFCGIWFISLSFNKKATPRISEKSSLVADKFLLGLLDLPVIVYILWSTLRYGKKAPHTSAKVHPLEYVYPKDASRNEHNLVWGVDDQRVARHDTRTDTTVNLDDALDEKEVDSSESIVSDKEPV